MSGYPFLITPPNPSASGGRRPAGRLLTLVTLLVLASSILAGEVRADTAPIPAQAGLPWTDPAHQSPFEVLAGQIASHIAGKTVTVRCEAPGDWSALAVQRAFDPNTEDGYVGSTWSSNGDLLSVSTFAELAGPTICLPLEQFAMTATKPTKCASPTLRKTAAVGKASVDVLTPCYLGNGEAARQMPASYWQAYESYGWAMLTLAHESIHLGGIVSGVLPDGTPVGDPQAEAKANCYGMQWIPYVAEQLGDTPDDAQSIADYVWQYVYPPIRDSDQSEYWSADCRPGGALDLRARGTAAWP